MSKKRKQHNIGERLDLTAGITITALPEIETLTNDATQQKALMDLVGKSEIKLEKALGYGEIEVIVSNSALDRHGEKIIVEGIDTKQVMKNPVVLWAHDYSGLPIGQIVKLWKSAGNLMAKIKLDYDLDPFADTVYKMILRGTINAVSIGGIVKEFDEEDYSIIKKLEMIELSVVPVGAHPDALVTSKSIDMDADEFKKQYETFVYKSLVDKFRSIPENEIKKSVTTLKSLVSALESSTDSADSEDTEVLKPLSTKKLVTIKHNAQLVDKQVESILSQVKKYLNVKK